MSVSPSAGANRRLSPPQFLSFIIAGLILAGAVLLWLPFSSASDRSITFLDSILRKAGQ